MSDANVVALCTAAWRAGYTYLFAREMSNPDQYRAIVEQEFDETHLALTQATKVHFRGVDDLARFQSSSKYSAAREEQLVEALTKTHAIYVTAKAAFLDARREEEATRAFADLHALYMRVGNVPETVPLAKLVIEQTLLTGVWSESSPVHQQAVRRIELTAQAYVDAK